MNEQTLAWHFSSEHLEGELSSGELKMCARPLEALLSARGPIVCRVELSGSGRKVLWSRDASEVLRDFALWCTSDVFCEDCCAENPSATVMELALHAAWHAIPFAACRRWAKVRAAAKTEHAEDAVQDAMNEKLTEMLETLGQEQTQ